MEASSQFEAPAALPQGKSPRYPLDMRLSEYKSQSGRVGEEKKIPATAGNTGCTRNT
jgi:hypothetical protein